MKSAALALSLSLAASAHPQPVNDAAIVAAFENKVGALAELDEFPTADELKEALSKAPQAAPAGISLIPSPAKSASDAVFLIGSVYKCGRCDRWHPGGLATAWAISSDGLMVTNQHVFAHASGKVMAVFDRHGNSLPITGIIAAHATSDIALFRVRGESISTLPLGPPAEIGAEIQVISHPNRNFFFHTFGRVARYTTQPSRNDAPEAQWMNITADFAKGSSGGPVINNRGEVVGMVASTRSIYYESEDGSPKGPLQMVIKNCVPAAAIQSILGSPTLKDEAPAVPSIQR